MITNDQYPGPTRYSRLKKNNMTVQSHMCHARLMAKKHVFYFLTCYCNQGHTQQLLK